MKKKIMVMFGIVLSGILILCLIFHFRTGESISIKKISDNKWNYDASVLLCYSGGHEEISDSEVFFYNGKLKKTDKKYLTGISHIYPCETVTQHFAIPLGYETDVKLAAGLGQIIDYKNYEDVEVLVLNDWQTNDKKFIVAYNKNGTLSKVDFSVTGEAYLGTYKENEYIYVLINLKEYLLAAKIDTNNGECVTETISYEGFVRDRTDLSTATTTINNGILYIGEATYNTQSDEVFSTISSYNLKTKEIRKQTFQGEWIYNLSKYDSRIIALFAAAKDETGYYKNIKLYELKSDLSECDDFLVDKLPQDIDTMNFRDNSKILNDKLYTIINGNKTNKSYIMVYDLEQHEIEYLADVQSNSKRTLFDWNFYFTNNDAQYEIE